MQRMSIHRLSENEFRIGRPLKDPVQLAIRFVPAGPMTHFFFYFPAFRFQNQGQRIENAKVTNAELTFLFILAVDFAALA